MQTLNTTHDLLCRGFAVSLLTLGVSCSSGSGGGGTVDPATVMAAGIWSIAETITQASVPCEDEQGVTENYQVAVQQSGLQLTVTTPAGTFNGTIASNGQLSWTGSFPEDGGTTTITSMALSISGDSLSGTTTWSFEDGSINCNGMTSITGSRTASAGLLGTGTASVLGAAELHDWFGDDELVAFATHDDEEPGWQELGRFEGSNRSDLTTGTWRFAVVPRNLTTYEASELPAQALELADPLRVLDDQHTVRVTDSISDWIPLR